MHASVSAEIVAPGPSRPLEGSVSFFVDFLPSSSPGADFPVGGARAPRAAVAIARALERQLRDARALDSEALCVVPALAAWALRVDVRIIEDAGNAGDAAAAATLAALLHFRLPDVTLVGRAWTVHPARERVPKPLAFHHTPVTVTLAAVAAAAAATHAGKDNESSPQLFADPTSAETAAAGACVTIAANAHGELCGLIKSGPASLPLATLAQASLTATTIAKNIITAIREALSREEIEEGMRAKVRHTLAGSSRF